MANSARQRKVADEYMRTAMSLASPARVEHVLYNISVLESFDYLIDPLTCGTRHKVSPNAKKKCVALEDKLPEYNR